MGVPRKFHYNPDKIQVRRPIGYRMERQVPKHWLDGNLVKTHFFNALALVLPDAKNYSVQTVRKFLADLPEAEQKNIQAYIGQGIQHKRGFEKIWTILEAQNFGIHRFLEPYNLFGFGLWERFLPRKGNLALVLGLERITEMIGILSLESELLKNSDPWMKEIHEWHCAEVIEHRGVVKDLCERVGIDEFEKFGGIVGAGLMVIPAILVAEIYLIYQDEPKKWERVVREARDFFLTRDQSFWKLVSVFFQDPSRDTQRTAQELQNLVEQILSGITFEPILNTKSANVANGRFHNNPSA